VFVEGVLKSVSMGWGGESSHITQGGMHVGLLATPGKLGAVDDRKTNWAEIEA
jgi:hypothetical protein